MCFVVFLSLNTVNCRVINIMSHLNFKDWLSKLVVSFFRLMQNLKHCWSSSMKRRGLIWGPKCFLGIIFNVCSHKKYRWRYTGSTTTNWHIGLFVYLPKILASSTNFCVLRLTFSESIRALWYRSYMQRRSRIRLKNSNPSNRIRGFQYHCKYLMQLGETTYS